MKIGVILASSQKEKNKLLFDCTCRALENMGIRQSILGSRKGIGGNDAGLFDCRL